MSSNSDQLLLAKITSSQLALQVSVSRSSYVDHASGPCLVIFVDNATTQTGFGLIEPWAKFHSYGQEAIPEFRSSRVVHSEDHCLLHG